MQQTINSPMRIGLAADHGGFELKEQIKEEISERYS